MATMGEKLKLELDIIIFTLVINLGFFKLTEIETFVSQLGGMFIFHNLGDAVFVGAIVITYFIYVVCVGMGLYNAFKKKDTSNAIVLSLVSFFGLYLMMTFKTVSTYEFPAKAAQPTISKELTTNGPVAP
jgi:hypothetical protein